ncbi:MAG: hypothetical protein EBQ96_09415 [Proteobacteria bacterium]|nr:hypothetical protein [Pseudomonadota bacterium]
MARPQEEALARTEVLLRDAEEALQQERLNELWKQWGSTLIGMALMLVIGTGAGVAWREWNRAKNEKATTQLVNLISLENVVIGPETERDLGNNHAAIAYLTKAGKIAEKSKTEIAREELSKLYAAAARAGDDTTWGWLARWNELRIQMDDEKSDTSKLLKDYEHLASERKGEGMSALVLMDAAIIAGERLKEPTRALDYLAKAQAVVSPTTPMASLLSDLKHLYQVRALAIKDETKEKAQ